MLFQQRGVLKKWKELKNTVKALKAFSGHCEKKKITNILKKPHVAGPSSLAEISNLKWKKIANISNVVWLTELDI